MAISTSGLLSGIILGYSVHRTVGTGWTATTSEQLFGTTALTTAVIAALVGLVATWLPTWGRVRYAVAFGTGLAGLAVLAALHTLPAPDEWNELPLALGIGLGLLIVPSVTFPAAQRWFFSGVVASSVLGFQLDTLFEPDRYRFRNFPSSTVVAQQPWQFLIAGLTAIALLAAMWWSRGERIDTELSGPSFAFAATLAIAAGLVVRLWSESGWLPAASIALGLGAFVAGRRWLPPHQLTALAATMAAAGLLVVFPELDREPSPLTLIVACAALIGGAISGLRIRRPASAVGFCAAAGLIATLSFASETDWVRLAAAASLLFAIAMTGTSCLPMHPALLAGWSVLPTLATLVARQLPTPPPDTATIPRYGDWLESEYISLPGIAFGRAELTMTEMTDLPLTARTDMIVPGLIATGLCAACAVWLTRHGGMPSGERNAPSEPDRT